MIEQSYRKQMCEHGFDLGHQIGPDPDCGVCNGRGWASGHSGSDAYTADCFVCVEHCWGSRMVPDDRLQDIANAPRCEHGKIDGHPTDDPYHPYTHGLVKNWCPGAPELRSLLDVLIEEE